MVKKRLDGNLGFRVRVTLCLEMDLTNVLEIFLWDKIFVKNYFVFFTFFLEFFGKKSSKKVFTRHFCLENFQKNIRKFRKGIFNLFPAQKSKFWQKSKFSKKAKFWQKIEILTKNRKFDKKSKFWQKIKIKFSHSIFLENFQ